MSFYSYPRIVFLGYPKTGTTWIQLLFRIALVKVSKLNEKKFVKNILEMCEIECTHNLPNFNTDVWKRQIVFFDNYANYKILFITRDPRDTILSLYMDLVHRVSYLDEDYSIDDFVKHPIWGLNKFLKYHMIFSQTMQRGIFEKVVVVRYEDFHEDTLGSFMRVAEELGMQKAITEKVAKYAVEYCKFENMKEIERENRLNWNPLSIRKKDYNPEKLRSENFKCRTGKVGEYRKYFSQETINWMDKKINKEMPEIFGYGKKVKGEKK